MDSATLMERLMTVEKTVSPYCFRIASNISAEQFVGMSGSGYAIGLAMATYEWIAALGLILVAKFFIPIFLEKKIFTMPQFLE